MMSSKPHVFVALLATCMLLVNAGLGTKPPENETTTVEPATTVPTTTKTPMKETTTTEPGTTAHPTISPEPLHKCENLTMDRFPESTPRLPSDFVEFKCSCSNEKGVPAACPDLSASPEAEGLVKKQVTKQEIVDGRCTMAWNVVAVQSAFKRRRIEAPIFCRAGRNTTQHEMIIFEKKSNDEWCVEDVDCWSEDQICEAGLCSCYRYTPSFVPKENKCYTEASYGRRCEYDEQCMSKDKKSFCNEKVCKCQENYRTKSKTDFTCTESMSTILKSSQVLVATATSMTMVLLITAAF